MDCYAGIGICAEERRCLIKKVSTAFGYRSYLKKQTPLEINFKNLDLETRAVYRDIGPEETYTLSELVRTLEDAGAAIGTDGAVRFASYGVGAASAYAASGNMALAEVNGLTRELYAEAVETLGEKVVKSKNSAQLAKVEAFLKRHPKYNRLMSNLKELPRKILPEGKLFPATNTRDPFFHARHFRKQFVLPYSKHNVSRYVDTIGRRLNGKIGYFKAMGRATTWVIPAVLGAATVASAPPELRVRTAVAEGIGIFAGAAGTTLGALGANAAISVAFGLTISPAGLFVVALIGGAVVGAALYEAGKWGGGKLYDSMSSRQSGRTIHLPDLLMKCH